jgi:hypothetical protein
MEDQTEFNKFESLVRQVVKVPKSKVTREENKSKKTKRKKRK